MRNAMTGLLLAAFAVTPAQAQESGWALAAERLTVERSHAESCAALLKRHAPVGSPALWRGERAYADGKAVTDGVISGLRVALVEGEDPASRGLLAQNLALAHEYRLAVCGEAVEAAPDPEGARSVLGDVLGAAVEPLVTAVLDALGLDAGARARRVETILAELEAARWLAFGEIAE